MSGSELRVADFQAADNLDVTNRRLKSFISKCPRLVSLVLRDDLDCVTDATVETIANYCPNLEKLYLRSVRGLTDLSVTYLSSLSHLLELDVMYCPGFTISGLQTIARSIPNIELFCFDIGEESGKDADHAVIFQSIGSFCPRLRVLKCCSNVYSVYDDGSVLPLFPGCPLLEEFEVVEQSPSDYALVALGHSCPRLRFVELGSSEKPKYACTHTDRGLMALAKGCPELTRLKLCNLSSVTDKALLSFAEHCHKLDLIRAVHNLITSRAVCVLLKANPGITSIQLGYDCLLNGEVLLYLAQNFRTLVVLRLLHCQGVTSAMLRTLFTRCNRLETLTLFRVVITDTLIETLMYNCRHLEEVELFFCPKITELSLSHLLFRLGKHLTRILIEDCSLRMSDEFSPYYTLSPSKYAPVPATKPRVDLLRTHRSISWTPPSRTPSRTQAPLIAPSSSTST